MSGEVDRRRFLKYSGAASAVAGGVWVAPSVLGSSAAFAAGSCINHATLDWDNLGTGGSMPAPSTGGTVTGKAVIPASGSSPAIQVKMTVARINTPGTGAGVYNGILNQQNGGIPGSQYFIGMSNDTANEGYKMTFEFYNTAGTTRINVYQLDFTICDIDRSGTTNNGYQDVITLSPAPTSAVPGSTNVTGSNPYSATAGDNTLPTSSDGNLHVTYSGPVNTVVVDFTSGNRHGSIQSVSIADLSWCY